MQVKAPKSVAHSPVPLHRVAVLLPFTRFLTALGMPVEREFRRLCLPMAALEDANNYVPSERFRAFVVNAARREGIDNLGFEVGRVNGANCADPHMRELLRRSPTLLHGLRAASELTNRTVFNCRLGLYRFPNSGQVCFFHRPSCPDRRNLCIDQIGWFGLMTLLGMIREFTGPRWQPAEIGLMTDQLPGGSIRSYFARSRFRLNQPFSYMSLEGVFLGLEPAQACMRENGAPPQGAEYLAEDFLGSVRKIVRSYVEHSDFSVDTAASLCMMSTRSFQRQLNAAGTSYSELLAGVQFEAATRLLRETDTKVSEISYRLGYRDAANFARAFRRNAGLSPSAYRQWYRPELADIHEDSPENTARVH